MKIAFNSHCGDGTWMMLRLLAEGHKVDYYLGSRDHANILCGIVPDPIIINGHDRPSFDRYDLSVFDLTGSEKLAAHSKKMCPTIGDGELNCALEDDRAFAMEVMEGAGIMVPPYEEFDNVEEAKKFVKRTGKCYVYKPSGGQDQTAASTFVSTSSMDMLEHMDKMFEESKGAPFVLQEFIRGCEVSTEGFFNGQDFYLVNSTLEIKKFMNDDKGPSTGCAGSVVFIHGLAEPKVYTHGLKKMQRFLGESGYVGPIDLNTIATPQGLYGLEFTPRFGYDAIAQFIKMYAANFGDALYATAVGERPEQAFRGEFCASVRLSIPPYPTEIKGKHPEGVIIEGIEEEDYEHTYLYDVQEYDGCLESAGHSGLLAVPMGIGGSISEAFWECCKRIDKIKVPGLQYRTDVEKCLCKRYCKLIDEGWLSC
jgi:phosphoribosylamine-glycine ligase